MLLIPCRSSKCFFFPFCHFALAFACSTYAMQKFYFLKIFFFLSALVSHLPLLASESLVTVRKAEVLSEWTGLSSTT